jgi:hypothetical protein
MNENWTHKVKKIIIYNTLYVNNIFLKSMPFVCVCVISLYDTISISHCTVSNDRIK